MRNLARSIILLLVLVTAPLSAQTPLAYDILISEMMIDPNPVVGLPNFEWIELYNRSDKSFNLEDFRYSSGATKYNLPNYILAPGAYVMICDDSDIDELQTFGAAVAINTFPTLTNSGDVATLEDDDGLLIHEVDYDQSWYGDTKKDDGGYTLELINPNDPCQAASNWQASSAALGGTPSAQNSNWMPTTPSKGVVLENVVVLGATELEITFNRIPGMISEMSFVIEPSNDILDVVENVDDPRLFTLTLASNLSSGVRYNLMVDGNLLDCVGESSGISQQLEFVLPESYGPGDLKINEILFNPIDLESDYVEIYNNSDKFIDINRLMVGNLDSDGNGSSRVIPLSYIFSPQEFLVITEKSTALLSRFPNALPNKVIEVDLPAFNNSDGNVTLFLEENGEQIIIDAVSYDEDLHNSFIDDLEGVALERVDVTLPSTDRSNWQSASSASGYGTPTLPNSQGQVTGSTPDEVVTLRLKTFYPDRQINQSLDILFDLERSDFVGTIDVYDDSGRYIYQLANNQLMGRRDQYTWNGRDASGQLQKAGVYIIATRLITSDGTIISKKLPCVLSRAL